MENFEENYLNNEGLEELAGRFERMVNEGKSHYYEVDDLEDLLEHFIVHHRLDLAFKVVETAKQQYPYNKQMSIKEAELLSMSDRPTDALNLLDEVENLEFFNPEFHLVRANVLSQIGKYQNAIQALEQALEFSEEELDTIYLNIAIEHQNLEQYHQAIDFLNRALSINAENEDAIYELAYCFELVQDYDTAISTFNKLIDKQPYNAHAWYNLGTFYQSIEENEKSLIAFDYALVIDEGFNAAYFNKANVLVRLERYDEAIALYKKALDFEILDSLIYFYIGDCYDHIGDHKNALIHFEKALKKDSNMAEAWIGASSSLDMLNRDLEALEYAKKAILIDPENGEFWNYQAGLQAKYKLHDEAYNSFEKAIEFDYEEPELWERYIQMCLELGNLSSSLDNCERALAEFPENLRIQLYKAVSLYLLKKEDEAFELLVSVLLQDKNLIEEFILLYPKGIELDEIQYLIDSIE